VSHIPIGSMCASCSNRHSDCSDLDFKNMKVLERVKVLHDGHLEDVTIVKCTNWSKRK